MKKIWKFIQMFSKLLARSILFLYGFTCILIAFEGPIINIFNPAEQLSYTKTIQLIENNQVKSIELFSNDIKAEIYLKDDNTRYVTNIPNEEVFCEFVQEKISIRDDLTMIKTKKSIWDNAIRCGLGLILMSVAFSSKSSNMKKKIHKIL